MQHEAPALLEDYRTVRVCRNHRGGAICYSTLDRSLGAELALVSDIQGGGHRIVVRAAAFSIAVHSLALVRESDSLYLTQRRRCRADDERVDHCHCDSVDCDRALGWDKYGRLEESRSRNAQQRAGGDGGMTVLLHAGRYRPAAPQHER